MSQDNYLDFVTSTHSLYDRYYDDWQLCIRSFHSGPEYKDARYLRAYAVDLDTKSEQVNIFTRDQDGSITAKSRAKVEYGYSEQAVNRGQNYEEGSFYGEKLENTPIYNYVKLIVSEYNSILFRNPPMRSVGESPEINSFMNDVDGEGNSLSEFMSQVDMFSTIFGVVHVGCYKPIGSDIPKFKIHTPLDVTNWSYKYDEDGTLKLDQVVIEIESSDYHSVYRVITDEFIDTVFVGVEDDYVAPIESDLLEDLGNGNYRIRQINELGYPPITTIYQSIKVYNNIGSTVIFDVAGIQRSIYGYAAEQYSSITYGAHPTLVVDETTDQLNDGQIGAEPGAVIRVQGGLTGEPQYVYEFVSPTLDALSEITSLIDNQIQKLTQISMLRSEDLIKAARSGEQIEIYDDKLATLIRKKATNLENAEFNMFKQWYDWTNQNIPEDFNISYNRQYNKRALETELGELNLMISVLERYNATLGENTFVAEEFDTVEQAEARAEQLGGSGSHSHTTESGDVIYMPFTTHEQYEQALEQQLGVDVEEEKGFKESVRDKIRGRLEELLNASSTSNGL